MTAEDKYVDVVKIQNGSDDDTNHTDYTNYLGNAIGETSTSGSGNTSYNGESSNIPKGASPFVVRTGRYGYTAGSGMSTTNIGFRPTMTVVSTPTLSGNKVSVLTNCEGGTISGTGTYASGNTVTLTISMGTDVTKPYTFNGWQVISGGVTLSSTTATTVTFTMGSSDVVIVAKVAAS